MLIEFRVSNFKSIKDEQVLSFNKTQGKELDKHYFSFKNEKENFDLLHTLVIYGANASGKSNVLDALLMMKKIVMKPADIAKLTPYLLSAETENTATQFEVTFIAENIRYQYGFSATTMQIQGEYLYQYPKGRLQLLFERTANADGYSEFKFGSALKGRKNVWKESTSETQLLLTTALFLNAIELKSIENFFHGKLRFLDTMIHPVHSIMFSQGHEGNRNEVLALLKQADLDIDDIVIKEELFDEKELPIHMPKLLKEKMREELEGEKILRVITQHQHENGDLTNFDLRDESLGTQRFFALAAPWLMALKEGHILVVDELNISLHPSMVKFLIQLFYNPKINIHHAQLLFTTHDPSLLSQDLFRRDQVWFCEKKQKQTQLYSLAEFSVRKESTSLERDYLNGRFGAVPVISNYAGEK